MWLPLNRQPSLSPRLPIEQGPDITLSTTETHPPAAKKPTSIMAPNTITRAQPDAPQAAPLVVKNEVPAPAPPSPAEQEPVQPPAPGSLDTSNANNQAISGIMSTAAASLPHQAAQQLKVSQGVSQGLLIKSVPPCIPRWPGKCGSRDRSNCLPTLVKTAVSPR